MNLQPMIHEWPLIAAGIKVTLIASFAASILAIAIGIGLGLVSQLGNRRLYQLVRVYVYVFRGVPLLVLLFLSYYALPAFGLVLPGLVAGTLAFGLNCGAYLAEVVRSALESVDVSQKEAAALDGASAWVTTSRVIFPQAAQRMVAPSTNQIINMVKGTALLSVISITDLTRAAQLVSASYFIPFEAYISLAALYLVIVTVVTRTSIIFERRLGSFVFS